jgi:hypothetical protein
MYINLFLHLITLAVLIGVLWALYEFKKANRWRPIDEAPDDKTLLLLRVEYDQGVQNPLFMVVDEKHDRLYNGDIFVTIGYRKPNSDGRTYYAVCLGERGREFFADTEVCPIEFRLLPKPISHSSH